MEVGTVSHMLLNGPITVIFASMQLQRRARIWEEEISFL